MSEKCKHGIRDTTTNLPYCRRCDQEAASELAAPTLLACATQICEWHRWESGQYETKCDNVFEFTHEGIKENNFKYCPFCGGSITEKQANDEVSGRSVSRSET